jgi:hypothetical protein
LAGYANNINLRKAPPLGWLPCLVIFTPSRRINRMVRYGKAALLMAMIALAGCARTTTTPAAGSGALNVPGSATAVAAVEDFMKAVKAQDLQQMGTIWGTEKGPARDLMKRDELEKRLVIIQCLLSHDSWSFAEQGRLEAGRSRNFSIDIRKGNSRARTTFTTVQGPGQRWYLENVDVTPLKEFCS